MIPWKSVHAPHLFTYHLPTWMQVVWRPLGLCLRIINTIDHSFLCSQGPLITAQWPGGLRTQQFLYFPWALLSASGISGLLAPLSLTCSLTSAPARGLHVPVVGNRGGPKCAPQPATNGSHCLFLLMLIFPPYHGPDIQPGKLQLAICPPPALSSHANHLGHTMAQTQAPQPQA